MRHKGESVSMNHTICAKKLALCLLGASLLFLAGCATMTHPAQDDAHFDTALRIPEMSLPDDAARYTSPTPALSAHTTYLTEIEKADPDEAAPLKSGATPKKTIQLSNAQDFYSSHGNDLPALWPVKDPKEDIISAFGMRSSRHHNGLDIKAPTGTPVVASASGTIDMCGVQRGYGNVIKINHENGFESTYAHLSAQFVKQGQRVAAGQVIGEVGATGNASGPHLHYEIKLDGEPLDPILFVPAMDPAFASN